MGYETPTPDWALFRKNAYGPGTVQVFSGDTTEARDLNEAIRTLPS